MSVISYHSCYVFSQPFAGRFANKSWRRFFKYSAFVWLAPAIFVAICVTLDKTETFLVDYGTDCRAANYCRTSDNVRLNLANVRAKVILIGHWSDHKKKLSHTFFCCDKIRLQIYIYLVTYTIYVRPNLVVLVFVRPNSSYVRPKLEVIGQMSCQVKYLFAALDCWLGTVNAKLYLFLLPLAILLLFNIVTFIRTALSLYRHEKERPYNARKENKIFLSAQNLQR